MASGGDFRVRDVAEMFVTLRPDLVLSPRQDGDEPGYLIEDKMNSRFFRIGLPEYTFIALLDGKTSVSDAVGAAANLTRKEPVTEEQATSICRWLIQNQLAYTAESAQSAGLAGPDSEGSMSERAARWNPLFLKIPLLRPDRLLTVLLPWTSWIFSWPATLGAAVFAVVALYEVLSDWTRFLASSAGILSSERWLWSGMIWLAIKVVHELAHGIVCKRYSGIAREAGVQLILGAPLAYIDVTSSWRFCSKWQRIHTAIAGIYIELVIASFAAMIWSRLQAGVASDLCFQTIILAGVATILFNANPLMRFDGYYIFTDLLGLPNLATEGQQIHRHITRRVFWGVHSNLSWTWKKKAVVALYGTAALVWRVLIMVTILLTAATTFKGAGIALAAVGIAFWVVPPSFAGMKYLIFGTRWEQPKRLRLLLTAGGLATLLVVAGMALPWPGVHKAPAMAAYAPLTTVRTATSGFVRDVCVAVGQTVQAGQVLAVLENEPLRIEVADLRLQVQRSADSERALRYEGRTAEAQAEAKRLAAIRRRLHEREEQLEALVLRAPVAGTITSGDVTALRGRHLREGTEVLSIGCEERKELTISIAQEDLDIFKGHLQQSLRVRIRGLPAFHATLSEVSPRALSVPSHAAFCAPMGGPLAVTVADSTEQNASPEDRYQFLAPRFDGRLEMDSSQSLALLAGQRGFVLLRASDLSIVDHLAIRLRSWLGKQRLPVTL
jgi:putative peptide zinc metalloprotease protein